MSTVLTSRTFRRVRQDKNLVILVGSPTLFLYFNDTREYKTNTSLVKIYTKEKKYFLEKIQTENCGVEGRTGVERVWVIFLYNSRNVFRDT